mgnify:FL=1
MQELIKTGLFVQELIKTGQFLQELIKTGQFYINQKKLSANIGERPTNLDILTKIRFRNSVD